MHSPTCKRESSRQQVLVYRVALSGLRERHALATGTYKETLEQKIAEYQELESRALESYTYHWSIDAQVEQQMIEKHKQTINESPLPDIDVETCLMEAKLRLKHLIKEAKELNAQITESEVKQ